MQYSLYCRISSITHSSLINQTHRASKNPFAQKNVHKNGPHNVKVEGHSNILKAKMKSSTLTFWGFLSKETFLTKFFGQFFVFWCYFDQEGVLGLD